ncbi:hypothetical protein PC120_g10555 [Phytophthora cactorum]|nr:hypothetical protein PC120_g10555 [Phytophthora cactorum]
MADILSDASGGGNRDQVREPPEATTTEAETEDPPSTQEEHGEEDETEGSVKSSPSPEDTFELDSEQFAEEQARTPWMRAIKAFLEDGVLTLDPQLRVLTLRMALRSRYGTKS